MSSQQLVCFLNSALSRFRRYCVSWLECFLRRQLSMWQLHNLEHEVSSDAIFWLPSTNLCKLWTKMMCYFPFPDRCVSKCIIAPGSEEFLFKWVCFFFDFLPSSFSVFLFSFSFSPFECILSCLPFIHCLNTFHLNLFPPVISTKALKKNTVKCTFEIVIYYITTNKTSP